MLWLVREIEGVGKLTLPSIELSSALLLSGVMSTPLKSEIMLCASLITGSRDDATSIGEGVVGMVKASATREN